MAGRRGAPEIVLSDRERSELESLARRRKTAQALAMRARIVLACAEGRQSKQVAAVLGLDQATVGKCRHRYAARRLDDLRDEPRSGAPRTIDDARIEAVIVATLESLPEDATRWSSRGMAWACGLSTSTVQRIWRAFGLQPHRLETFKALYRPRLRRNGARRGRALHVASGSRHRPVRRREITNPGSRPQPADAADASRPAGASPSAEARRTSSASYRTSPG
jgi:transposase